jgi:hypothetical protein
MSIDINRTVIALKYRGVIPLQDAKDTKIDCLHGRIWISEWGCNDDIVLEAGQGYVITRGGVALVQALREALVKLREPAACSFEMTAKGRHVGSLFQTRRCTTMDDEPRFICPITAYPCEGDLSHLCEEYGCARKGGLSPQSEENLMANP